MLAQKLILETFVEYPLIITGLFLLEIKINEKKPKQIVF